MKVEIPFLPWTGKAALEIKIDDGVDERFQLRAALEVAVKQGANLAGANFRGAYLGSANLAGANLAGANLEDADFRGANLAGANFRGANLAGANFRGASLSGHKVTGTPLFIAPIGSESGTLEAWPTEDGLYLKRGCFFGTVDEFTAAVEKKHGGNEYGRIYRAAVEFMKATIKEGES